MLQLALASSSLSQALPPKCNPPVAFQADLLIFDPNRRRACGGPWGSGGNKSCEFRGNGKYAYDSVSQSVRIHQETFRPIENSTAEATNDILELWEANPPRVYLRTEANEGTVSCVYENIDTSKGAKFPKFEVPTKAKFTGIEVIGSVPDAVELNVYQWSTTSATDEVENYMRFTARGCIPVTSYRFSNLTGFHYEEYSNVELGSEPSHFKPPLGCKPVPPGTITGYGGVKYN